MNALSPVVRPVTRGVLCGRGEVAASSTLLDGLISWWSLNEASGTRADSHGSNNLTDVNTVGSAAGKVSNAADFVAANDEYLSGISPISGSFSLSCWLFPDTVAGSFRPILGDWDNATSGGLGWVLQNTNTSTINFYVRDGATSGFPNISGALSSATWVHVVATYDDTTKGGQLVLNDGTPAALTFTGLGSGNGLRLGHQDGNSLHYDGRIDECAIWNRVLTASEITELYNSGNGIGYPG